jgi:AAA domain
MSLQIENLRMSTFGPFEDATLDLGPGGGALHVICGPNEAGKTTTQRAISDFIFGIPARSSDGHEFGFTRMRIEATVIGANGESRWLVRRKGNTNTLLDVDGNPVDEGSLVEMLGGLSRDAFASMFSITHRSLVDGGKALLAADGNLGESLFSASLGAAGLHTLRAALREEGDKLFRPKATSTRIAQVRSELQTAESRLRAATLRPTPYLQQARELEAAMAERCSVVEELEDKRGEQLRRDRLRVVLPKVVDRGEMIEELACMGDTPQLAPDSKERRLRAEQDLLNYRGRSTDAEERVERLLAEVVALEPDQELLKRGQSIRALAGRVQNINEAKADLERQTTKVEISKAAATRALEDLHPGEEHGDLGRLRVGDAARAQVSAALQAYAGISTKLEASEGDEREAAAVTEDLKRRLEGLDEPNDVVEIRAAAAHARPHSALEEQIAKSKGRLEDAREDLRHALADLRPSAELDALLSLDWPDIAELQSFLSRAEQLGTREREVARAKQENFKAAADFNAARPAIDVEDLPDEEKLLEVRTSRDSLWAGVKARLEGRSESEVNPEDFEDQVRAADRIADRLREEADEVAAHAQRDKRRAANRAALAEIEGEEEELLDDRRVFTAQWEELWRPYGLQPRSPREMESWLGRRSLAVDRSRTVNRIERELEADEALLVKHVSRLRSALRPDSGSPDLAPDATLGALLGVADHCIATAHDAAERRDRSEGEVMASQAELEKHRRRVDERKSELESWQASWKDITARLGWSSEIGPQEASKQLERVVDLTNHLNDAEESERRCRGIEKRISEFDSDAAALLGQFEVPDLAGCGHVDAVADLAHRLEQAKEIEQRREDADARLLTAREDLTDALSGITRAETELAVLMEQASVTEPEHLVEVERRVERARHLRDRIPGLEQEIVAAGKEPLDDLVAVCEGLDVDQLEARSKRGEEGSHRSNRRLASSTWGSERSNQNVGRWRTLTEPRRSSRRSRIFAPS